MITLIMELHNSIITYILEIPAIESRIENFNIALTFRRFCSR